MAGLKYIGNNQFDSKVTIKSGGAEITGSLNVDGVIKERLKTIVPQIIDSLVMGDGSYNVPISNTLTTDDGEAIIFDTDVNSHDVFPLSGSSLKITGDATIDGTLTAGSQEYTHIIPTTTNTYDLGSPTKYWRDIYVSSDSLKFVDPGTNQVVQTLRASSKGIDFGSAQLSGSTISGSSLHIEGDAKVTGDLTLGGTITLGDADTDTIKVEAEYSGSMIPDADDVFDLGSSSKEWKDLYVDGTANIDTLAVSDGFTYGSTTWNETAGAMSITGSDFLFKATTNGSDLFKLVDSSDDIVLKVQDKVIVLGARSSAPTAIAGGIYYADSDEWYLGYE